jgi:hypothetical protein
LRLKKFLLPKIKGVSTRPSRNWLKNGWRPRNMRACILNIELLLFCMVWPINFLFRIRHCLWDTLSINMKIKMVWHQQLNALTTSAGEACKKHQLQAMCIKQEER